jgi:hypothetical protein
MALSTAVLISGPLAASAQTYDYSGSIVTDTITQSGVYDISVFGGAGGAANSSSGLSAGGEGAELGGDVYLTAGTQLEISVGQAGQLGTTYMVKSTSSTSYYAGGGGGGSFVYVSGAANPLIVAGGGGGAGYGETGANASLTTSGTAGGGTVPGAGLGGTNGAGGSGGTYAGATYGDDGGGGGGWLGNGTAGALKSSGGGGLGAFVFTGGAGGTSCLPTDYSCSGSANGGFGGGGGGGYNGGGGGGGYSGGGGGSGSETGTIFGGGGGSYIDASVTNQSLALGNLTDGQVVISEVSAVPLPASAWLMLSALGGFGFMRRKRQSI